MRQKPHGSAQPPSGPRILESSKESIRIGKPEPVIQTPGILRPSSTSIGPVGIWTAHRKFWSGRIEILVDGTFTSAMGSGTWKFDGRTLQLMWAKIPPERLELASDGTFHAGDFVMRKT